MTMDKYFPQPYCDRCGKSLKNGRMMSMFNEANLCLDCIEVERKRSDYHQTIEADHAEIRKGNFNFKGIGKN